jgi:hypothetical protein
MGNQSHRISLQKRYKTDTEIHHQPNSSSSSAWVLFHHYLWVVNNKISGNAAYGGDLRPVRPITDGSVWCFILSPGLSLSTSELHGCSKPGMLPNTISELRYHPEPRSSRASISGLYVGFNSAIRLCLLWATSCFLRSNCRFIMGLVPNITLAVIAAFERAGN